MADALEAAFNDLLPAYAELFDKVAEDGVDSLRQMLDVAEDLVTEEMIRGKQTDSGDAMPRINRSCKSVGEDGPSKAEVGVAPI
ncbi:hypothetical protein Hanom_Chr06g00521191 [Helianthus anomalus]